MSTQAREDQLNDRHAQTTTGNRKGRLEPARLLLALALALLLAGCMRRPDALSPIITIVNPQSGTVRTADDLTIEGYALDDEGIRAIRVNGVDLLQDPIYASNRGKGLIHFRFQPRQLSEGQWISHIEVEDVHGRVTARDFPLQIDATRPMLEQVEIGALSGGRLLVSGVARDNGQIGTVKVNDIELSFVATSETPFSVAVDATDPVTITVTDEAGNRTEETFRP